MAFVLSSDRGVILSRIARLRAKATEHKSAVRRARAALQQTMTQLAALEADCRRRGISTQGVEEESYLHGRIDTTDRSDP